MKKTYYILGLVLCLFALAANAELPPAVGRQALPSLAPMLKNVMPTVVNISVTGDLKYPVNPFLNPMKGAPGNRAPQLPWGALPNGAPIPPSKFESLASGVIVDAAKGYILTNAHVLRNGKIITVTLNDGRQFQGKLVGADPASDVAVIQIQANDLKSLPLGNSDELNVGDFVVAIGNPFGLKQSVTSGIVSALQRTGLGIEGYENFIQTDASINPGNSGGALVNLNGQLVGINTAILAPDGGNIGIGFAIPIDMAKNVMQQLIQFGSVQHGRVGIMIQNLTPNLAGAFDLPESTIGAIVTTVNQFSPAQKSGIQPGDVIVQVNGKKVKDASAVTNIVGLMRAGSDVKFQIMRNNKLIDIDLLTASTADYEKLNHMQNPFLYGMNLRNFDQYSALQGQIKGVQVTDLMTASPAAHASPMGIMPGDVILSANNKPVKNISELEQIAKMSKNQLLLNVYRGGGSMYVVVK